MQKLPACWRVLALQMIVVILSDHVLTDLDAFIQSFPRAWLYGMDLSLWDPPQGEEAAVELCNTFDKFSERSYFSRVWVIQELFGGKDRTIALCGDYQLDWEELVNLDNRLDDCFNLHSEPPYAGKAEHKIAGLDTLLFMDHYGGFSMKSSSAMTCAIEYLGPSDLLTGPVLESLLPCRITMFPPFS